MKKIFLLLILCVSCLELFSQTFKEILEKAEKNDAKAQCAVAMSYRGGIGVEQDDTKAVQWLQKSASLGHPYAQYLLAISFCAGIGIEENLELGFLWGLKSAKQGISEAQCLVAQLYGRGDGVEQNPVEAIKWCTRSAEQGNIEAQIMLYESYRDGFGVAIDFVKASLDKARKECRLKSGLYTKLGAVIGILVCIIVV